MRKVYFLFLLLLCFLGFAEFAQATTVTIYAIGMVGANNTGTSTATTYTEGDINAGFTGTNRGFAVFDLSFIPAGAIVGSVTISYTVAGYSCGAASTCSTYGYVGNVYTNSLGVPATLFGDLVPPSAPILMSTQSYGNGTSGFHTITSSVTGQNLVQDNEGGFLSISFTNAGTDNYDIIGEMGLPTPGLGCAPYITVTYCTAPNTITVYPSLPVGHPDTTGSSTGSTFTPGDINVGNGDISRGYAVYDLSAIPSGSFIASVVTGIDVAAYTAGATGNCVTYGFNGDISPLAVTPGVLFPSMVTGTVISRLPYGGGTGNLLLPTSLSSQNFIQNNLTGAGTGFASLTFTNTGTDVYDITGEVGTQTTTGAHAPFLQISYYPPPSAVTASAGPNPICYGSALGLTATATGANKYAWTGPGGFSSTQQNPVFPAAMSSTGVYTLTASNGCGNDSASAASITTASIIVTSGPITGITNVWVGFTTQLSDVAAGGTWGSTNPAVATVDGTGQVTGVAPGVVTITYTTATCVFSTQVTVVISIFSQMPTIVGSGTGSIIAWIPFCEDTTDHSGLGHDLHNGDANTAPAVLVPDRFGVPDNAFQFNGVNTMMWEPTYFPVAGSGPTGDYTYSVWMEADDIQNSIIEYNGNPHADGFGFVMNDGTPWTGPASACNIYTPGPGNKVAVLFGDVGIFLPTAITLHQWHNLVLKKNGNSYDFYIDDVSVGFFISPFNPMTTVFAVGVDYVSTTTGTGILSAFKGNIDDIAIYNRQLSNAERDSLYNFNPDARQFTLGNDTTICSDSITLSAHPPTPGNDYFWGSPGTFLLSTDSSFTVDPVPGVAGNQYWLKVGKPYGCLAFDTIMVYKSPIPISIGPDSVSICLGDTITLTDATVHSAATSFTWSTGSTSNSITISTPGLYSLTVDSIYHFTRLDSTGTIYEDSTVCVGRDTVHLHVYPVPIIGIPREYSNCQGVPDTIRPHFDSAYNYLWGIVGLASSSSADTFVANTIGSTSYWLRVNDTGCFRIDTISVLIVWDTLTFLAHDTAICLGQSWPALGDTLVTNNFIANYQWTPTEGIPVSNIFNPVITPDTSTEYILTVTYPRCPTIVDSFYLDVQPNPTIFPGNNRSVCQFDSIHIAAGVTPAWYSHYIYTWSPSTSLDASTTSTVVVTPDTVADINLVVTVTTPVGCSAKDSVQLFVHPGNFLNDTFLTRTVCPNDSTQLTPFDTVAGSTLSSFSWSPGLYLSDSMTAAPWVHAITSLNYKLIGMSQYGCRDTLLYSVTVAAAAVLYMTDSVFIYPGESYLISPQTNCVNFLWSPAYQIDDIHSSTPQVSPIVNTTYIVQASTEAGCTITDSIKIKLSPKSSIDLPNAFTPGSSLNGKFFVIQKGNVALKYFRIFNRWGNKVFETHNIDEGWDGTYNGKPQPFDVYTYEVEAQTIDGEVFQRVGNVTLLR